MGEGVTKPTGTSYNLTKYEAVHPTENYSSSAIYGQKLELIKGWFYQGLGLGLQGLGLG